LITEVYPAGIAIRGYATRYRFDHLPAWATPHEIKYEGGVSLAGYRFDRDRLRPTDDLYHPPSAWIHTTLFLTTDRPMPHDLEVSLRLVDEWGQIWGDRLHRAGETLLLYPTSQWSPGEYVRVDVDVNLNPLTPAGEYLLEFVVTDAEGRPLPRLEAAADTTRVELARITILD